MIVRIVRDDHVNFESPGSFAIVWVAFPYDRPDRLNIFLRRLGQSGRFGQFGRSYGNQALVEFMKLRVRPVGRSAGRSLLFLFNGNGKQTWKWLQNNFRMTHLPQFSFT